MVPDNALVLAGDDHRDAGCVYHGGADRAEQHSSESAPAVAADHDELGRLGFVEEMAGRLIKHNPTVDGDIGEAFLKAGEPLGQRPLGPGPRPVESMLGAIDTSASLQACNATKSTPPGSFLEGDFGGQLRCRRAMEADQHRQPLGSGR